MLERNVREVLERVTDDDYVLDVGGWYKPLCRADVVVDLLPYSTRGLGGRSGDGPERFDATTWVTQDICSAPMPFPDKTFDFVVCSHTLEDLRDPVYVCSELVRVAKRGYVEVPSRIVESVRGLEGRNYVGHYHHRWLVEIQADTVLFRFKPHAIHEDRRYHLPRRRLRALAPQDRVTWLFWEGSFNYAEVVQVSHVETLRELAAFVDGIAPLRGMDRLRAVVRAPRLARWYRDWQIVRHPLDVCVRRDAPAARAIWGDMAESLCTSQASTRTLGTPTPH